MKLTDRAIEIGMYCIEHGPEAAAKHFDRKYSYVERAARKVREQGRKAAKRLNMKRASTVVGVIGDTHFPFTHPRYLDFCRDTFEAHGVGHIVHIGDIIDHHAISRHKTEPVADGVLTEFDKAKVMVDEWAEVFPVMTITNGNHDNILERQAAELGVPPVFLKSNHELYQMPTGWKLVEDTIIDDVLYKHGIGSGGMHGAYNSAKRNCMSVVQGHTHAFGGVKYISNPTKLWFGMSVGCGIDVDAYAFAYGKHMENRPIIGVGVVKSSQEAQFIPMDMSKYGRD
jgi:predicted phosphodiesterase